MCHKVSKSPLGTGGAAHSLARCAALSVAMSASTRSIQMPAATPTSYNDVSANPGLPVIYSDVL